MSGGICIYAGLDSVGTPGRHHTPKVRNKINPFSPLPLDIAGRGEEIGYAAANRAGRTAKTKLRNPAISRELLQWEVYCVWRRNSVASARLGVPNRKYAI